ncbi:MAG: MmgE/PrpD family protein [Phycisphaerales bacterium]|nr:MmgE/PrpD family protein [Phycisphaerales bacterium]
MSTKSQVILPADSNQALGLARYAIDFMSAGPAAGRPDAAVLDRTEMFHTDAVLCGASALALGTNAPTVLRNEALGYRNPPDAGTLPPLGKAKHHGACVFGSRERVKSEKAILANCAAVREWDSNGTNFGYSEERPEHRAGEFGHNDFYAVPVAAAQMLGEGGAYALRGMVLLDEIRGRLAEVFSLKTYKIDHVVHGAIASAATFGAMMGATAEQIESAIGMVVAHHIPFRAIRHGHQLSDSKGASAAISTEAAIVCMKRAMAGFIGPQDIFRNPEAVFCLFKKDTPKGKAPFDLVLSRDGADFAVMGMHFKLGLYEHQSAGALQGLIDLLGKHPQLLDRHQGQPGGRIARIVVTAYEPAFGIIGDPAKRDPHTRQSADHSMLYLVCTKLRKALELAAPPPPPSSLPSPGAPKSPQAIADWRSLMLLPHDFSHEAIRHPLTRALMEKMTFQHGGPDYDQRYPDGIPTSMQITDVGNATFDSGLVMYPAGHARNRTAPLKDILRHKWNLLGALAVDQPASLVSQLTGLNEKSAQEVQSLYDFDIQFRGKFD